MLFELLGEIYKLFICLSFTVLAVVYVALIARYVVKMSIRFVSDGTYKVDFFPGRMSNWVSTTTFGMNVLADEPVGAVAFGMLIVPGIYAIGILLWPVMLPCYCFYLFLLGARKANRFRKKVETHMEHLQGGE